MKIALVQLASPTEETPRQCRARVRTLLDGLPVDLVAAARTEFPVLADRLADYRRLRPAVRAS